MKQWLSTKKILSLFGLIGLLVFSASSPIALDAQPFAQGFDSDERLDRGTIVVLDEEDSGKVEAATIERVESLYGVVINPNDAPVTLADEDGDQTFVSTAGRYRLLVSDQNGPIEAGDFITISSLAGIGMQVNEIAPLVVGRALEGFDGSNAIGSAQVGDRTVQIGRINADIQIGQNPFLSPAEASLPDFLRRAAESVVGDQVSANRVYIATFVFIVSTFVAGSLMYSGVRSSIISVGRNPLSKKSIIRGMLQVIVVGLIIFIIGVFGVYLILRL